MTSPAAKITASKTQNIHASIALGNIGLRAAAVGDLVSP
jgi:hypothetical protein